MEQERKQQIYMSLKEVQSSKQTHDEQDKDWQQTCKENSDHIIYTTHKNMTQSHISPQKPQGKNDKPNKDFFFF